MDNTSVGRMLLFYIEVPTARVYLCGYFYADANEIPIFMLHKKGMISMHQEKTKALVESGLLLALATILSLIKIFDLPYGGSITLASMLPIVIIAYRRGLKWGLGAAGVYSVLQMLTGMQTVSAFFMPGDSQEVWWRALLIVFLDYIVAFTVIGFAAIFRKKASPSEALCLGAVFGLSLRFLTHIVSGAIFFGSYAEWFFSKFGDFGASILESYSGAALALIYSVIYNATYMIPEIIITACLAFIAGKIPTVSKGIDLSKQNL